MKKFLLLMFLVIQFTFSEQIIKIRPKQSVDDASHSYYVELLKIVLKNTEKQYGKATIKITDFNATQGRSLDELEEGKYIDIDWAGTSIEREKNLIPIRVPLIGGLLGYRVPVIKKSDKKKFDEIKNLNDLKTLIQISGTHWPDSDIMESAGLNVYRVPKFEQMYPMLESGRVDYFPRGINEVYGELKARNNKELMIYDRIIIAYKFPMYFFTNKKNIILAQRLEKGLMIAVEDGSLLKLIKTHPVTAPVFPLDKYKNSLIFEIKNQFLPKETPLNNEKFWIKLK